MTDQQMNEEAIRTAVHFKTIRSDETPLARRIIADHGLGVFAAFCKARENTGEDPIYRQLGTTREWVESRLKP